MGWCMEASFDTQLLPEPTVRFCGSNGTRRTVSANSVGPILPPDIFVRVQSRPPIEVMGA